MSVDILMYRAHRITQDELNELQNKDVYDVNELNGFEFRTYSLEEMSKNPARFEQIDGFLKTVDLMHTQTDYKACYVAHGMPAEITSYSFCNHYGGGVTVSFDGGHLRLTKDDLDKFTTTTKKTFGVLKREHLDVDVDNWLARELMKKMEEVLGCDEKIDLSYFPIRLNAENCAIISEALVDLYDDDALYPNAELAKFMLELMRVTCNNDDVFIEFQD